MTTRTPLAPSRLPADPTPASLWLTHGGRRALVTVVLPLLAVTTLAWVLVVRDADMMMADAGPFLAAWLLMMIAMMLPAAAPVVAVYALAARRHVVAAVPVFVAGYLAVWATTGVPAFAVSRWVSEPLMAGEAWVARLTGATLLVAALYQLTPLKRACLRHCRSPLAFFLGRTGSLSRPTRAFAAGARHGAYCLGCCWALMAVLVVLGGMQLGWALALALALSAEKLLPGGPLPGRVVAALAAALGTALLAAPALLDPLVQM